MSYDYKQDIFHPTVIHIKLLKPLEEAWLIECEDEIGETHKTSVKTNRQLIRYLRNWFPGKPTKEQ